MSSLEIIKNLNHFLAFCLGSNIKTVIKWGNFLEIQCLRLYTLTVESQISSLVGKLKSHKPCGMAKKKEEFDKMKEFD